MSEQKPSEEVSHPRRVPLPSLVEEQTALHRVATLLANGAAPRAVLDAVAEESGRLVAADLVTIERFGPEDTVTILALRGAGATRAMGNRTATGELGEATRVRVTGQPSLLDRYTEETDPIAFRTESRAAVSLPITVGRHLWGAMTVALRRDERSFPEGTEARLAPFTALAAIAIANAQAREELQAIADEQAALRRVAALVARGVPAADVYETVVEEVHHLLRPDTTTLTRIEPERWTTLAVRGGEAELVAGLSYPALAHSLPGVTDLLSGRTVRVDRNDPGVPAELLAVLRSERISARVVTPVVVMDRVWGSLAVLSRSGPLPAETEQRLAGFSELVATAISNTLAREELTASRARIAASADATRQRIVRDLHDGAQQRLVHTIIALKLAARAHEDADEEASKAWLSQALEHAEHANTELRELVRGILPGVLVRGGLVEGVKELVSGMQSPVRLALTHQRFAPEIEANAYFIIAEALTNVAKHSDAQRVDLQAEVDDGLLRIQINDDGMGGADAQGSGLRGMNDRVVALGGTLEIESPPGGGTRITAAMPLQQPPS